MEIQIFEYLENEKSFLDEIKNIFHSFWRAIIWLKIKNWWQIADTSFKNLYKLSIQAIWFSSFTWNLKHGNWIFKFISPFFFITLTILCAILAFIFARSTKVMIHLSWHIFSLKINFAGLWAWDDQEPMWFASLLVFYSPNALTELSLT